MAQSFSQAQSKFLSSGKISKYGSNKSDFEGLSLDASAQMLAKLAEEFALMGRENLQKADRVASGKLEDSIMVNLPIKVLGTVLSVDITLADYFEFVDQGVKGWKSSEKAPLSPFQFKKRQAGSGVKSSAMVTSIRKWLIKEGLKQRNNKYTPVSKRESKRKKFTDTSTQTAIIIAASIKRTGLKPSYFWMKTVALMKKRFTEELSKSLKIDIINSLPEKLN